MSERGARFIEKRMPVLLPPRSVKDEENSLQDGDLIDSIALMRDILYLASRLGTKLVGG